MYISPKIIYFMFITKTFICDVRNSCLPTTPRILIHVIATATNGTERLVNNTRRRFRTSYTSPSILERERTTLTSLAHTRTFADRRPCLFVRMLLYWANLSKSPRLDRRKVLRNFTVYLAVFVPLPSDFSRSIFRNKMKRRV